MAKKKASSADESADSSFDDIDSIISKVFEDIIDIGKVETKVDTFYDTGVYTLNYMMSRRLNGGVARGRITGIDGLSGTGKSLVIASTMRDPRLTDIIVLESEGGGAGAEIVEFAGVDKKKVKFMKVNTLKSYKIRKKDGVIEECKDNDLPAKGMETDTFIFVEGAISKMRKLCQAIQFNQEKFRNRNILVVIDSLANLTSVRQLGGTADMGKKNIELNEFFKAFDVDFEKLGITFMFTNKVYQTFDEYNPYTHSGGEAVIYNPSVYIRLTTSAEAELVSDSDMKEEKERRKSALGSSFKTIKVKVIKGRFGTEQRAGSFVIDHSIGPVRLSGLFTLLCDFGVITSPSSGWYEHALLGKFRKKDFISLVLKNEKAFIEDSQLSLEKAEAKIKEERLKMQVNDEDDFEQVEDEIEKSINSAVVINEGDEFSEFTGDLEEAINKIVADKEG